MNEALKETLGNVLRWARRWVMWSPRRFCAVVAALVVAVVVLGSATAGRHRRVVMLPASSAVSATSATTEAATATLAVVSAAPSTVATKKLVSRNLGGEPATATYKGDKPVDPAITAAVAFVRLWVKPAPAKAWVKALAPLVTLDELAVLRTINPLNVPVHAVTGHGVLVRVVGETSTVQVPTDEFPVYVNVVGGLVDAISEAP